MVKFCKRCIMNDKNDSYITFDKEGNCNYCNEALNIKDSVYFPNKIGERKLNDLLKKIRQDSKNNKYDCIMGISGGLDSSYLAYLGFKWGLRVLAIHIDDGFDTEKSINNIQKLIKKTGFDYEIIKPDEIQYNDLTLSYMKAGVPNIAIPQDNILFAFLYKKMKEYKIKYFLSGGNFALESILQKSFTYKSTDVVNILDIHNKFGTQPIDKLEFISTIERDLNFYIYGLRSPRLLNYIEYNKEKAIKDLYEFCGFEYYGSKHLENVLTAFVQLFWLPNKFGVDKRTSHLSSMIVSNQIDRDEAIKVLNEPIVDKSVIDKYSSIIKSKFNLSDNEFETILNGEIHKHEDYSVEDNNLIFKIFILIFKVFNYIRVKFIS